MLSFVVECRLTVLLLNFSFFHLNCKETEDTWFKLVSLYTTQSCTFSLGFLSFTYSQISFGSFCLILFPLMVEEMEHYTT